MQQKLSFNNQHNAEFFHALRSRINRYFTLNKISPTGNINLYTKTVVLFAAFGVLYSVLVFIQPESIFLNLFLAAILGMVVSAIGFNVMHDGGHGSYSSNKRINKIMAYTLNGLGGNANLWAQKHNIAHHTYTNIEGFDDDIDIKPFIRVNETQPKRWFHKFQVFYFLFLYSLTYLFWVLWRDYQKYFSGKIAEQTSIRPFDRKEHIKFWTGKVFFYTVFFIFPAIYVGFVPTLVGYLVMSLAAGLMLAIVFQLAHVEEGANFISPDSEVFKVEHNWAVHQIATTCNFATNNEIVSWVLGGLNFQVEHHLFPKISHIHYPKISRIVKNTCKEYGIQYREYETMLAAFWSHTKHLNRVGKLA
ncbi:MAG: fatty acid desaturase family protein [Luteibaculaceae bacterium]